MAKRPDGEWWAVVTHQFQVHVREEEEFIDSYEKLASDVSDPGTRFLVELIVGDERRHHELMADMATAARGEAGPDETPPPPPDLTPEEAGRLLGETERFLEAEREDRERLHQLAKQLRPARDDTMWYLMVELMDLDTAKHIKMLEYLVDRLRRAAR
ncbi:MAG: hypothetical protein U5R31_09075 [Acidimicrobiia bacterium]|nr:hypothetical protein [Acidimicrobiia bacterium]